MILHMSVAALDDAAPADRFNVDGVALTLARMTVQLAGEGKHEVSAAVLRCTGFSCAVIGRKTRELQLRPRNGNDCDLLRAHREDLREAWRRLSPQWGSISVNVLDPIVDELVHFESDIAAALRMLPAADLRRMPADCIEAITTATVAELDELGRLVRDCSTVVRYRERQDKEDKIALRLLGDFPEPTARQVFLLRGATVLALRQRRIRGVNKEIELIPEVAELVAPTPESMERSRQVQWLREHQLAAQDGFESLPHYMDRLWLAVGKDPQAALGRAKELMEAAARWAIELATGHAPEPGTPFGLLTRGAHKALGLAPSATASSDEQRIADHVMQAANQVAGAVGSARNAWGDGHGRPQLVEAGDEFVAFAAHVATGYARFIVRAVEVRGLARAPSGPPSEATVG